MQPLKPILLVESDRARAETIRRTLEAIEVTNELVSAACGEEALAYLVGRNNRRPCVILVDFDPSRTDHTKFLKTMKMQDELNRIPVVAIVASHEEQNATEASDLGAAAHILPCADPRQFEEELRSVKSYCLASDPAESGEQAHTARRRVLLIEDDPMDQIIFRRHIKDAGLPYDYTIAGSAAEARTALESQSFDIVISDYMLGDGTGFDILPLVKDAPVVLVTGAGDEEIAVKAWKAGAYDYLAKDPRGDHFKALAITVENAIEHRRAQREVELLSGAMMSADDCIYITDMLGRIIFVNNAFCRLYGYARDQILGRDASILWTGEQHRQQTGCVLGIPTAGGGRAVGFYHERRDGTIFPVSLCRSIIKDAHNRNVAVVGIARDMSERLLLVDEFHDEITTLAARSRQCNKLTLAALATLGSLLASDNADRALHLITGLCETLKIETGGTQLERIDANLRSLTAHIVETVKPLAAGKDIPLENDVPDDGLMVHMNRDHAIYALTGILRSLIDVVPPGSPIRIHAEDREDGVMLEVRSNEPTGAIGKAHEAMNGTNPFHEPLDPHGDIGLNLFVANRLLELYGASVRADGEGQQTSGLLITLPRPRAAKADPSPVGLSWCIDNTPSRVRSNT
ncbi:MAG: response regulator [Sedimentisphaerales bacterium]|nr:response regulator [Sedimentisphaerales bacterium]